MIYNIILHKLKASIIQSRSMTSLLFSGTNAAINYSKHHLSSKVNRHKPEGNGYDVKMLDDLHLFYVSCGVFLDLRYLTPSSKICD